MLNLISLGGLNVIAEVGHETMHSPHWTHDDANIASFRSNPIPVVGPLPVRPITRLFFTSSQARMQRSQRMQLLCSIRKTGEDESNARRPLGGPITAPGRDPVANMSNANREPL